MSTNWERVARVPFCLAVLLGLPAMTKGVLAAVPEGAAPAPKAAIAPIHWTDLGGRRYDLTDIERRKATVFLFASAQCPISNIYVPRMVELARDYRPKGVQFFLVNSSPEDDATAVRRYAKERGIPFLAVKDDGTALADRLGAQATPEAIVLDATGTVRYKGRIDDHQERARVTRRDVREALDALLAGTPIERTRTIPFGCAIFRDRPANAARPAATREAITYTRDVATILNENCVVCHRKGEVAPFALETYQQARVWAQQIKQYTARRLMPPWKAVSGFGDFRDVRSLTDEQIATVARWADAGAPLGDAKELLPAPRFPAPGTWTLGTPDLVLEPVRAYHLEAEGRDVYRNFVLPIDFKEDRYFRAMEFQPDNRAVVHHIVTYMDPTGESAKMDGREPEPGYTVPGIGIGIPQAMWGDVWVPGSSARFLPPGVAVKIPAGAKLVMQVHYHKTGKPEVDRSRLAIYWAKDRVEQELRTVMMGTRDIELRPGLERQELRSSFTLPVDVRVWSAFPHMHVLGREMKLTATLPDGTVKPLVWVNDWDFNWQATYHYKEPVPLPKGTKIDLLAVYDNSEKNPRQPSHPPKLVRFGEQTTDEMCFAFFGLTVEKGMPAGEKTASAARAP